MDNFDKGLILEDIYKKKLMSRLVGDPSTKEQLADRLMNLNSESELNLFEKKPVYEEIEQIPLDEQLRLMKKHLDTLKDEPTQPSPKYKPTLYNKQQLS